VAITATPTKADPRLIGNTGVRIKAIVLTQVSIVNAEVTVADRDSSGTGAVTKYALYLCYLSTHVKSGVTHRPCLKCNFCSQSAGITIVNNNDNFFVIEFIVKLKIFSQTNKSFLILLRKF